MIHAFTDHRADDAEVVNAFAHVWEEVADRDAALAAGLELPQRLHQWADGAVGESERAFDRQRLAVIAQKALFRIEGVDRRRAAMHEQENYTFGLRLEMRRARGERVVRRRGQRLEFIGQQRRQAKIAEAAT